MAKVNWALLAKDVRDSREALEEGTRGYAKLVGLSSASVNRIEAGKKCDADHLFHITTWLGFSPNRYLIKP